MRAAAVAGAAARDDPRAGSLDQLSVEAKVTRLSCRRRWTAVGIADVRTLQVLVILLGQGIKVIETVQALGTVPLLLLDVRRDVASRRRQWRQGQRLLAGIVSAGLALLAHTHHRELRPPVAQQRSLGVVVWMVALHAGRA